MMNKFKSAALIVSAGTTLILAGCGEEQDAEMTAPLRQVRTIVVESGTGRFERSFSGTLQSSNQTSYSFKVSGTIESIPVEVGQSVNKGDVLAILDPSDYELEVQKSRASLVEQQSKLRNAKADYERTKKLCHA